MVKLLQRLTALSLLVAALGCNSTAPGTDSGADAAVDAGLVSCYEPLSAGDWLCAGSIAEQIANNPCNDYSTTIQSTCGQYQVWRNTLNARPGLHVCIYDNNQNGALVGAKTCGDPDSVCTDGCIEYRAALPSQVTSCGPEADACPP